MTHKIGLIGCGVMQLDVEAAAQAAGVALEQHYLEAGLHDNPGELKRRLQAKVDELSASGDYERIVLAYGICGRGVVGIQARQVPLVVPRVNDCIALFLGSDQAYREQFASCPGTFYISAGWFEKKVQPRGRRTAPKGPLPDSDLQRLTKRYGEENGRAIADFLGSWKRNYQRVVFIDTGAGDTARYEAYARAMAEEFGWDYERVSGSQDLVMALLTCQESSDQVLWVPPRQVIRHDPLQRGLTCGSFWEAPPGAASVTDLLTIDEGAKSGARIRYGLGIDAGGTYTDVVIYAFESGEVLAKAKALTTKWDYTVGISEALDQLPPDQLAKVELAAISTTLATNAVVEGQGQPVGLLIMPPPGRFQAQQLGHRPVCVVRGRLDISGREEQPPDEAEIRRVARQLVDDQQVGAFAVSGYAGTRNPAHELHVKAILQETTGLDVVCGHELSDQLNVQVRATTAALNARIIPMLSRLIEDVDQALRARRIEARLVVVKGDGSLMSTEVARQRPIETILSGPAASVAGARFLTGLDEATVIDIGGTTSDVARVREGCVELSETGARVGGWRTHVRALDIQTTGLGGDSSIIFYKQQLQIGPQRIAPISWLARRWPQTHGVLDWLTEQVDDFIGDTRSMEIIVCPALHGDLDLTDREQAIVKALADGPLALPQLAERVGVPHWGILDLERLAQTHLIQRCGLTPTDLLHLRGDLERWDGIAARRLTELVAGLAQHTLETFVTEVFRGLDRRLLELLLQRQLPAESLPDDLNACPVCQVLLDTLERRDHASLTVDICLQHPVVGLGAPVGVILPPAVNKLGAELIVPEHADVANALGAITSSVTVRKRVQILPDETGRFAIHGLAEISLHDDFLLAHEHAVRELAAEVRQLARQAGTSHQEVDLQVDDRLVTAADGAQVLLERLLQAEISGPPDSLG